MLVRQILAASHFGSGSASRRRSSAWIAVASWAVMAAIAGAQPPGCPQVTTGILPGTRSPYLLALEPPGGSSSACGQVALVPAWSPFGIAVAETGQERYDLTLVTSTVPRPKGAPAADSLYVAWITTADLTQVRQIGVVHPGEPLHASVDWPTIMVVISLERSLDKSRWQGPIVLRGLSHSGLMIPLFGHPIFNRPHE
jgi:hypothetical protein